MFDIFALVQILLLLFPLVLVAVCVSLLEPSNFLATVTSSRTASLKRWLTLDGIFLLLWAPIVWLPNTEMGHRLFHQSHGEETSAILLFAAIPISVALPLIGMCRKKSRIALFLLLGAGLGIPSLYFFMFMWPLGYFVIAPLTCIALIFLVHRSIKMEK